MKKELTRFFPTYNNNKRGFTLVELIVTMGILVLVIIMIYNFFLLSIKLGQINSDKADAQAQTRLILQGLQKEIETSSLVLIGNSDNPQGTIGLSGTDYAFFVEDKILYKMDAAGNKSIPYGSTPLNSLNISYEKNSDKIVKINVYANDESSEYMCYAPNITSIQEYGVTTPRFMLFISTAE